MVLPCTWPLAKPMAGSPKATVSCPGFIVGADDWLASATAPTAAVAAIARIAAMRAFIWVDPLLTCTDAVANVPPTTPEHQHGLGGGARDARPPGPGATPGRRRAP